MICRFGCVTRGKQSFIQLLLSFSVINAVYFCKCVRLISPGRRDVPLLARRPEAERLLLVSGCDASWLPPAALNSPYVPTEIKPPVVWIKKNKKKNKKRRLHISFNSFSQMHYSDGIICWELRGSQRCSSTTEGRGLFKCLWLLSPPHRQTRGRRLLFNVAAASRFPSELSTFLNFTQPEIK